MTKGVIDRFEGEYALIEIGREIKDFPKRLVPAEAKEGDVVTITGEVITIDKKSTAKVRKAVRTLMSEVWED